MVRTNEFEFPNLPKRETDAQLIWPPCLPVQYALPVDTPPTLQGQLSTEMRGEAGIHSGTRARLGAHARA